MFNGGGVLHLEEFRFSRLHEGSEHTPSRKDVDESLPANERSDPPEPGTAPEVCRLRSYTP